MLTIDEEIADLRRAIGVVQANIAAGCYDKAEQEEMLRRHRERLNELMIKTPTDEMEKAFDHVVAIVIVLAIALIVIFSAVAGGLAGYDMGRRERESNNYRDKVNFCHDRMKNDDVKSEWKQMYCVKS